MIEVAERLFAERGIASVAMRVVATESGQRNHSAVQYHFGSRDGLVAAIIAERSRPIDVRRVELVADLPAGRSPTAADVVRVFALPLAEAADDHGHYLRFLANATAEPDLDLEHGHPHDQPGLAWVHREVTRLLRGAAPVVVRRRSRWLATTTLRLLADHERTLTTSRDRASVEEVVDDLVTMLAPLLRA